MFMEQLVGVEGWGRAVRISLDPGERSNTLRKFEFLADLGFARDAVARCNLQGDACKSAQLVGPVSFRSH